MLRGFDSSARFFFIAALFASFAAAQPGRLRIETAPRVQIRRLEEMRRQKGLSNPEYQKELDLAKGEFGLTPKRTLQPSQSLLPDSLAFQPLTFKHTAVRKQLEPLKRTQERLAGFGYLDPKTGVDGVFSLSTQEALAKFQSDYGLPETGKLDSPTQTALQPNPFRPQVEPYFNKLLILEDLRSNLSARYRLLDATGQVSYWGDDKTQLTEELNRLLTPGAEQSVYVEMQGFSEDKAEALATSLRIRQRLIDPSVSIGVLPHIDENPGVRLSLFSRGIKLEREAPRIESVDLGKDGFRFQFVIDFSVRTAQGLRTVTLRILSSTREFIAAFMEVLRLRCPSDKFDEQLTLAELIAGARTELKSKHPGLTDKQLRLNIVDQFYKIDLGLMYHRVLFPWS